MRLFTDLSTAIYFLVYGEFMKRLVYAISLTFFMAAFLINVSAQTRHSKSLRACLAAVEAGVPAPGSKGAADCVSDPDPEFPSAVNAHFTELTSHPAFYRESLSEQVEAFGAGSDQVEASKRSYGDLPLIVLTSTTPDRPDPNHPDPYFDARTKVVIAMHEETAHLSSRGINRTIPGATHHIMLTVPQAVVDAVNEVVTGERQQRTAARPKR